MVGGVVVLFITVMMASGATQEIKSGQTYPTMRACEAAKAAVAQRYEREHPDVKVQKAECKAS